MPKAKHQVLAWLQSDRLENILSIYIPEIIKENYIQIIYLFETSVLNHFNFTITTNYTCV